MREGARQAKWLQSLVTKFRDKYFSYSQPTARFMPRYYICKWIVKSYTCLCLKRTKRNIGS